MPQTPNKIANYRKANKNSVKTIYNPANSLFNKLTKFFSGPIVKFRSTDVANPNRRAMQKHHFTDIFGTPFKRNDEYHLLNQAQSEQNIEALRLQRYLDYDSMVLSPPEIKVALKIYANEIASYTKFSPILKILSPKDEIKEILTSLFYDTLNIQGNLFGWVQTMCKYGDHFLWLDIDPELGLKGTQALPVYEIQRLEGLDSSNPNYVQFQWNAEGLTFENVEIAHFRILGDDKYYPYGTSVLDSATKITKQLNLLIEHMMTYRIVRAPERKAFYMDVTGLDSKEVDAFLEKNLTKMKRQSITDPKTGKIDLRYDVASVEQEYIIPIKKGSETRIDPLPGGQFVGDIEDVEFLRDQLFTALMIPASFLTNKDNEGEAGNLAQKSMTFAKEILRIQNSVTSELRKMAMIHLITLGYSGKDILSFELELNNPSKLAEMQEFEHLKLQSEVASAMADHNISKRWIQSRIFQFSPEEIENNIYEVLGDAKFQQLLANIENQLAGGAGGEFGAGGGLGDLGAGGGPAGGLGGEIPGLDQQMGGGGNVGGGEPNPEDEFMNIGNEDNSNLLMKPGEKGSRIGNDLYLTPGAKGKPHIKTSHDGRNFTGQIRNQMNSLYGRQVASPNQLKKLRPESTEKELSKEERIILEAEQQVLNDVKVLKESGEERKRLINQGFNKYKKRKNTTRLIRRSNDES